MVTFTCDTRCATATSDDAITTGSVGIPVALNLASDYDVYTNSGSGSFVVGGDVRCTSS